MTGLGVAGGEELSRAFEPCLKFIIGCGRDTKVWLSVGFGEARFTEDPKAWPHPTESLTRMTEGAHRLSWTIRPFFASSQFLPGNGAPLKIMCMQFIAPDRNLPPLPGRAYNFLKRNIATPVLKPISGRPMSDHHNRFPIILMQNITQKGAHALDDQKEALPVREWLRDAQRELFLYLSGWIVCQGTIIVLTEPSIWHKRQITS